MPPARLAPPTQRGRRRSRTGAYQELPGGVGRGEHYVESPRMDYLRHRLFNPDPQDELRVLGFAGAAELAKSRTRINNLVFNMAHAKVQAATGQPHKPLSDDEIAQIMLQQAGISGDINRAAKTYTDIPDVPVPLPFSSLRHWYPTGAKVGHTPIGPSWLETPALAELFQTGHTQHKGMAAFEALTLYPFFRPLRFGRAAGAAVMAGIKGTAKKEIEAEAASMLTSHEQRLLAQAERATRNLAPSEKLPDEYGKILAKRDQLAADLALSRTRLGTAKRTFSAHMAGETLARKGARVAGRTLRANQAELNIPAAKGGMKVIEGLADAGRLAAKGKIPGVKSSEQRYFEELGRRTKYRNRLVGGGKMRQLQALGRKLSDAMQYAIRLSLEGSTAEEAAAHHIELARGETPLSPDPQIDRTFRLYHEMHASVIEKAAKYMDGTNLAEGAGKDFARMHEARDLMIQVAGGREADYKEFFNLSDEAIFARRFGPARVRAGARWEKAEAALERAMEGSPLRAQVERQVKELAEVSHPDSPERQRIASNAMMGLWDANLRRMARDVFGNQREWPAFEEMIRFGRGPIPTEALSQDAVIQMKQYYRELLEGASDAVLKEIPDSGPITLRDLRNAQRAAQELGDPETVSTLNHEIGYVMRNYGLLFQQGPTAVGITGPGSPFVSKMAASINALKQKMPPDQVLKKLKSDGVKDEEIEYTQLKTFMEGKKSVSKEELLAWLDEDYLQLQETWRGTEYGRGTQFQNYSLPGQHDEAAQYFEWSIELPQPVFGDRNFTGGHFYENNVLVHSRNTSRAINGRNGLLSEEFQSDWHQQGRKQGYQVPLEKRPEYPQRLQDQQEADQQVEDMIAAVKRNAYFDVAGEDIERELNVNLRDPSSVHYLYEKIRDARLAQDSRAHYEIFQRNTHHNENPEYNEWRMGVHLVSEGGAPIPHTEQEGQYAYGADAVERVRDTLRMVMDDRNKLIEMPPAEVSQLEGQLDALRYGYERRQRANARMDALRSEVRQGIPDAPFKDTWHELGVKRMLAHAVDRGFEKFAWASGEIQIERYTFGRKYAKIEIIGPNEQEIEKPAVHSDLYNQALYNSKETSEYEEFMLSGEGEPVEPRMEDVVNPEDALIDQDYEYRQAYDRYEDELAAYRDRRTAEWERQFQSDWEDGSIDWQDYLEPGDYEHHHDPYGPDYRVKVWRHGSDLNGEPDDIQTPHTSFAESSGDELVDWVGKDIAKRYHEGQSVFIGHKLEDGRELGRPYRPDEEHFGDTNGNLWVAWNMPATTSYGSLFFYNEVLPGFVKRYLKKFGVQVREERIGHRRVTRVYDVRHKGTAENHGRDLSSLEAAQRQLAAVVRDSQQRRYRIVDINSGESIGGFGTPEAAQYELDTYVLPQAREGTDYRVESDRAVSEAEFEIVPRDKEEWVSPPPEIPTLRIHDAGEHEYYRYQLRATFPNGRETVLISDDDLAYVEDRLRVEREEYARRAGGVQEAPFGTVVHSIDLPSPSRPDWNDFIQYRQESGRPLQHAVDLKALEEFQAWHPDAAYRDFLTKEQPLFQQSYMGPKGAIWQEPSPAWATRAVVNFANHGDLTTFVHEVFGHWAPRFLPHVATRDLQAFAKREADKLPPGAFEEGGRGDVTTGNIDPDKGPVDKPAAEVVAKAMERYIYDGTGPTPVKQAVQSLSKTFREHYDGFDIPDLNPHIRKIFDRIFAYEPLKEGQLIGFEDIPNYSVARVPTIPGQPLPRGIVNIHKRVAAVTQYYLSGGKVIAKGPVDKALMHEYKGAALMSGYFTFDAIGATVRDAMLAQKLVTVHRLREDMLLAGFDLPTSATDIAVKVNPDKTTPKGVQVLLDKMDQIAHRKGGKLTAKDMEQIDFDIMEEGARDIFPNKLFNADGDEIDVREMAQELLNSQQPLDNIKWVPQEWLDASGLVSPSGKKGLALKYFTGPSKALMPVDAFNDFNKLMILYLNPAYMPINLVGNLVMNFMQQGAFAPSNLWRSAFMHQWLEGWERKTIDNAMGNGLTATLGVLHTTRPLEFASTTLSHWINQAVDLIPRRAAFLHEARRAGYRSKDQIRQLLRDVDAGDEAAIEDATMIAYRANDAIVDYERMSPLERQITARLIFFYPWLKGATRYSIRFMFEHPLQFTALMLAAEHAYTYQQQQLGAVPFYEETDVPLATKAIGIQAGIPGIWDGPELANLSEVFGDHSWVEGKNPMVIDARQLLTFTTPFEIFRAGYGLATGDPNTPNLLDNLTPFISNTITTLQGYDSFRHKEVPRSARTFASQTWEGIPLVQNWKKLAPNKLGGMSAQERREIQQNAINPRTSEEDWWRLFGSGLAPAPFSYDVAAKRTLENKPTKIQHREELKQDAQTHGLTRYLNDAVFEQLGEYDDMNHELKQGMTPLEKAQTVAKFYKRHPELRHSEDIDSLIKHRATTDARANRLVEFMRANLERHAWQDYWRLRARIRRAETKFERSHLSG